MVLARGHGSLTKQVYLSVISSVQSAKFPCSSLALENINGPTAVNWITVGCIVVVNGYLIEPRRLTKKTSGIRCLSYIQTYTHQRKCHIPLSNLCFNSFLCYYKDDNVLVCMSCFSMRLGGCIGSRRASYAILCLKMHSVFAMAGNNA